MTDTNFLDVLPGDRLILQGSVEAIVTHNPGDGLWLFGRYVSHPQRPELVDGREYSIFAHDVNEIHPGPQQDGHRAMPDAAAP